MPTEQELDIELIQNARIFHFSSLSLTNDPSRTATRKAVQLAREGGVLVSYDPNLRPPLWKSLEHAKNIIMEFLPLADILKLSDNEFFFLTGQNDLERFAPTFPKEHGICCMFVTLGPKGAFYCMGETCGSLPAIDVPVVDTTGCGDAFMGTILFGISRLENGLISMTEPRLREIVIRANASGSLTARQKGAIPAIPTQEEVDLAILRT